MNKKLTAKDLVIGEKYVPHSKMNGDEDLQNHSAVWKLAQRKNQPFLYYTGIYNGNEFTFNDVYEGKVDGDFFLPEDMTPYVELSKFKKGDVVKVLSSGSSVNKVGDVGVITEYYNDGDFRVKVKGRPDYGNWMKGDQVELVKEDQSKSFEVEESFILAAHKAACSEWKLKIESKFPDAFAQKMENIIKSVNGGVLKDSYGKVISVGNEYICVPLPNANTSWTFAAFDWVKQFCEKYPDSYPVHNVLDRREDLKEFIESEERKDNRYIVICYK